MAGSSTTKIAGGGKKIGRNKRPKNQTMSAYVRGKISFAQYQKSTGN